VTTPTPRRTVEQLEQLATAVVSDAIAAQPPDAGEQQWQTALRGLRRFIAAGHGAEAERLGWPKNELYAVPPIWARVDLCGAGLLVGNNEVTGVTASEIRIKTASGSSLAFYRKPQPDLRLVYSTQLKLRRCDDVAADEEGRLRALEFTVNFHRERTGCDVETAKQVVMEALAMKETGT
jgi:hypothetical protein